MLLPVGVVVQFIVPHGMTQLLFIQVAPIGHCVASTQTTHTPRGSIIIPAGVRSHVFCVASSAQSVLLRHSTHRLFVASQTLVPVWLPVHPFGTVPHGVRPSATAASETPPPLPADPAVPAVPPVPPDPAVPPVAPVAPPAAPAPPAPPVPAVPVAVVVSSLPPQAA